MGCSFLKLPTVLPVDVISDWLQAGDVDRLDSACCSRRDRPLLLSLFKERELNIHSVHHSKYSRDRSIRFKWILARGVKCSEFSVGSEAPGTDALECIKLAGDCLRTFEVYNPCGSSFSRVLTTVSILCHGLKALKIWFWPEKTDSINDLIAANTRLQKLDIYGATDLSLDLSCVCLTHLSLASCVLSQTAFLSSGGALVELDLSQSIFTNTYQTANTIGAYCTQLQSLYLSSTNMYDADIMHIVTHCRRLTALDVSKCSRITDTSIYHIVLYGNTIQHLQIECNDQLTNYALEGIKGSAAVSSLTTLCIDSCSGFTTDSVAALLSTCSKITHLSTSIDENADIYLTTCVHLRKLDLLSINMAPAVCEAIATCCSNLQVLSLLYCEDVSVENLTIIANGCLKLRTIRTTIDHNQPRNVADLLPVEPNEYRDSVQIVRSWSNNKNIRCRW